MSDTIWCHTTTMVSSILVTVGLIMACHLLGVEPLTHQILTFSQLHHKECILINCSIKFTSFQSQQSIWKTVWTMSSSSVSCQRVNEGSIHKKSGLAEGSFHKKSGLVEVMTWHSYGVKPILHAVPTKMSDIMSGQTTTMASGILVNVGSEYGYRGIEPLTYTMLTLCQSYPQEYILMKCY